MSLIYVGGFKKFNLFLIIFCILFLIYKRKNSKVKTYKEFLNESNISWWNGDSFDDLEEENEMDDPNIRVGDFVRVTGKYPIGFSSNMAHFNNEIGEVIRIFTYEKDIDDKVKGNYVVKFKGRYDLLTSKLSVDEKGRMYKDCLSFVITRINNDYVYMDHNYNIRIVKN